MGAAVEQALLGVTRVRTSRLTIVHPPREQWIVDPGYSKTGRECAQEQVPVFGPAAILPAGELLAQRAVRIMTEGCRTGDSMKRSRAISSGVCSEFCQSR